MKTAKDLYNELWSVIGELKAYRMPPNAAAEITNAAGKMIHLSRIQLEYHSMRKETPDIPFLNAQQKHSEDAGDAS